MFHNFDKSEAYRECGRKVIHMLFGTVILTGFASGIAKPVYLFYLLIFGVFLSILSFKFKIPIINYFIGDFRKKNEKIPGKGMLLFAAGSLLALKLFSLDIALASIAILTFSDSTNYMIGKFFGKTKLKSNDKNIEGLIAGVLIGTLVAMLFIKFSEAFVASFFAMFVEIVEIKISDEFVDDNLLIPLVSGTAIYFFRMYLNV